MAWSCLATWREEWFISQDYWQKEILRGPQYKESYWIHAIGLKIFTEKSVGCEIGSPSFHSHLNKGVRKVYFQTINRGLTFLFGNSLTHDPYRTCNFIHSLFHKLHVFGFIVLVVCSKVSLANLDELAERYMSPFQNTCIENSHPWFTFP